MFNPPFSSKNWTSGIAGKEYGRFDGYGAVPPEKNGDYAWLLHILKSLKATGKAAVILPHGVLFRGNAEATIRESIIKRHYIKGIIGLPANLFYGTGIAACVIVIDKEDAEDRKGIFMIDASRGFVKDGNKNRLREEDLYKIVTTFNNQITDDPKYARMVPYEEIEDKNGYNLNLTRYIDSSEPEDLQDINAHLHGGLPVADVDRLEKYWNVFPSLKAELFEPLREGYYRLKVSHDALRDTIYQNREFTDYGTKLQQAFRAWQEKETPVFSTLTANTSAQELLKALYTDLLAQFEPLPLLDKYDVYQLLLAYWNEVMNDDVSLIIHDPAGYDNAKEIDNIEKLVSSKKKTETKIVGWEGRLIPKDLIRDTFFTQEQQEIAGLEEKAEAAEAERDTLVEEAPEESALVELAKEGSIKAALLKLKIKELETAGQEDDAQELKTLKKALELTTAIQEDRKKARKLTGELEQKCHEQYAKLTREEILDLLVGKKWMASLEKGINDLYAGISHALTNRIVELADRYGTPLPELEKEADELENSVKSHLEGMGFVW